MALPFCLRKHVICFLSEIYLLCWNRIHIFIKHFIFIWEWKTSRSKFGMEFPFPNEISILRVWALAKRLILKLIVQIAFSIDPDFILICHALKKVNLRKKCIRSASLLAHFLACDTFKAIPLLPWLLHQAPDIVNLNFTL